MPADTKQLCCEVFSRLVMCIPTAHGTTSKPDTVPRQVHDSQTVLNWSTADVYQLMQRVSNYYGYDLLALIMYRFRTQDVFSLRRTQILTAVKHAL
jgi:hypothetical protein